MINKNGSLWAYLIILYQYVNIEMFCQKTGLAFLGLNKEK